MSLKVKSVESSVTKWNANAGGAAQRAADEAIAAAGDWAANSAKSGANFQQAVSAGNMMKKWLQGISKAGAAKFARKVGELTAARYGTGIAAGQQDYRDNVAPYLQTIAGLNLTQRKPRGDPGNYQRVSQVGNALNAKRLATLGGGGG